MIFEYNLELILSKKMFKKSTKIRVKIYGLFISFTLNLKIFIGWIDSFEHENTNIFYLIQHTYLLFDNIIDFIMHYGIRHSL